MEIRAIQPADRDRYARILERTTEDDRYCRFFHTVNHLDPQEMDGFVNPRADVIGLIATRGEQALGAAHAWFLKDKAAEIALVVANDARQQGVGGALFRRLIEQLQARGYRHIVAYALAENHAMTKLAKRVGMHFAGISASIITWELCAAAA